MEKDVNCYYEKKESYLGEEITTTVDIINDGIYSVNCKCDKLEDEEGGLGDFSFTKEYSNFLELNKEFHFVTNFIKSQINGHKGRPEIIFKDNGFTFHGWSEKENDSKYTPFMGEKIKTKLILDFDNGHTVKSFCIGQKNIKSEINNIPYGDLEQEINRSIKEVERIIKLTHVEPESRKGPLPVAEG